MKRRKVRTNMEFLGKFATNTKSLESVVNYDLLEEFEKNKPSKINYKEGVDLTLQDFKNLEKVPVFRSLLKELEEKWVGEDKERLTGTRIGTLYLSEDGRQISINLRFKVEG